MSLWEPTIDSRRQSRAASGSEVDRADFDHITRERSRLRSLQYKHNRRREWRADCDNPRTGHRRELDRTREKGPGT